MFSFLAVERFLVLEMLPEGTSGLFLSVDRHRNITIGAYWPHFRWLKFAGRLHPSRLLPTVIVAVHPTAIYTRRVSWELRPQAVNSAVISERELEEMLSRAVTEISAKLRSPAARALLVSELDAILVGVRSVGFAVRGKRVLTPVGLPPGVSQAELEVSFTARAIFDRWQSFFNSTSGFFFTDTAQAQAQVLKKALPAAGAFLWCDWEHSLLWSTVRDGAESRSLGWHTRSMLQVIAGQWGVKESVAETLYEAFCRRDVSPAVGKFLEKILRPLAVALIKELRAAKVRGRIYARAVPPLPLSLPFIRGHLEIIDSSRRTTDILRTLGFNLRNRTNVPEGKLFPRLASFLEFYYTKGSSRVNRWLNQRVRWLIPII